MGMKDLSDIDAMQCGQGDIQENMLLEEPVVDEAPYALDSTNNTLYVADSIRFYFARIQQYPRLSDEQNVALIRKYREGDIQARDFLIDCNQHIVYKYANKYKRKSAEFMDLVQEGNLGLLRAIEKYEEGRGTKFTTYANYWVFQAVTRSLSNKGHMIRLPISGVELYQKIKTIRNEFMQAYGKEPQFEQIQEEIPGLTYERYEQVMQTIGGVLSLDASIDASDEGNRFENFMISEDRTDEYIRQTFIRDQLLVFITKLPIRLQQILTLRFGLDGGDVMTLQEVGDLMGISREGVRVLEKKALDVLREYINDDFDGYLQEIADVDGKESL